MRDEKGSSTLDEPFPHSMVLSMTITATIQQHVPDTTPEEDAYLSELRQAPTWDTVRRVQAYLEATPNASRHFIVELAANAPLALERSALRHPSLPDQALRHSLRSSVCAWCNPKTPLLLLEEPDKELAWCAVVSFCLEVLGGSPDEGLAAVVQEALPRVQRTLESLWGSTNRGDEMLAFLLCTVTLMLRYQRVSEHLWSHPTEEIARWLQPMLAAILNTLDEVMESMCGVSPTLRGVRQDMHRQLWFGTSNAAWEYVSPGLEDWLEACRNTQTPQYPLAKQLFDELRTPHLNDHLDEYPIALLKWVVDHMLLRDEVQYTEALRRVSHVWPDHEDLARKIRAKIPDPLALLPTHVWERPQHDAHGSRRV